MSERLSMRDVSPPSCRIPRISLNLIVPWDEISQRTVILYLPPMTLIATAKGVSPATFDMDGPMRRERITVPFPGQTVR